ncbi:ABC transporter permease [Actinoallomurus iriomotensis]|uniref:Peptide ABC transporter permease n=1 Tax=Actinoallomurus iriomotensis TaxID=478107 RepID=A0A9W6RL80_9ACTN|nr:ABC transporter permease [Actinoallomurus iriomotensis]GLY78236.1 peptide ABC transporter permease [Actinoallomurus iriomotensis]GLY87879.1 peptide ABC transporter permease [Actinoallomurus iriomotensis]
MSLTDLEAEASVPPASEEPDGRKIEGRSPWQLAWARLRKDKAAMISVVVIVLLIVMALLAPLIAKWVGYAPDFGDRKLGQTVDGLPVGPNGHHVLGTDRFGRDILVRSVYGARVSLLVGLVSTVLAVVLGVIIGASAGFYGGAIDTILARAMDVTLSFPYLLFALALAAGFGASVPLTIFVITFFSFASIGRIVRGQVLQIKEREFIEAARSLGAGSIRTMFIDVIPNLIAPVTVLGSMTIPTAIIFESTLSFLGAGTDPRTPTWGNMLSDATQSYTVAWWTLFVPAAFLLITTLAFNILGDAVRDALDPRSERLFAAQKANRKKKRK